MRANFRFLFSHASLDAGVFLALSLISFSAFSATCNIYVDRDSAKNACTSTTPTHCIIRFNTAELCGISGLDNESFQYSSQTGTIYAYLDIAGCPSGFEPDSTGLCVPPPDACAQYSGQVIDVEGDGDIMSAPSSVCYASSSSGSTGGYDCLFSQTGYGFGFPLIGPTGIWSRSYKNTGQLCDAPTSNVEVKNGEKRFSDVFDNRFTISNTEALPQNAVCSDNGDGTQTCITVNTTTTTETLGKGKYIEWSEGSTKYVDFNGNTRETTETETVTDDGHGTVERETIKTVTIYTGGYSMDVVSASTGDAVETDVEPSEPHVSTQTTTETTHPDGSTTTVTESSGTGGGVDGTGGEGGTGGDAGSVDSDGECVGADCIGQGSGGSGAGEVASDVIDLPSLSMSGFSSPSDGSCPVPETFMVYGETISLDYAPVCDFVTDFRPFFIAIVFLFSLGIALRGE